jgi:cystathionine beta-lyase/cystathionine gamma-synthase
MASSSVTATHQTTVRTTGGHSWYTVESHVNFAAQAKAGDHLYCTVQLVSHDEKRMRLFTSMHRADGDAVVATAEHMLLHVDTTTDKTAPAAPEMVAALEERVAALEGGRAGLASASGMAAETMALTTLLQAGDHVVAAAALYGGTVSLLAVNLRKFGIECTFVDASDLSAVAAAMQPNTRAVFAESLGNPSLQVLDIQAVADVAHAVVYLASPQAGYVTGQELHVNGGMHM